MKRKSGQMGMAACLATLLMSAAVAEQPGELSLGEEAALQFTLKAGANATPTRLEVITDNGGKLWAVQLSPDKPGNALRVVEQQWDEEKGKWEQAARRDLVFWPAENQKGALKAVAGLEQRSWVGRPLTGIVRVKDHTLQYWMHGQLLLARPLPAGALPKVLLKAGKETAIELAAPPATGSVALQEPLRLDHLQLEPGKGPKYLELHGIGFEVWEEGVSLGEAGWPEWESDPGSFYESYDGGPPIIGDRRVPLVQAPRADYRAAWVLARVDDDEAKSAMLTLRAGRRLPGASSQSQVVTYDFGAAIPKGNAAKGHGRFHLVKIPFTEAFAQEIEGDVLDIELTKEMRLARRSPDPCRFRWRPLGLPSGVTVAAITLEKSPIQFALEADAAGWLFEAPQAPSFTARLTNITAREQAFTLNAAAGSLKAEPLKGTLAPGATLTLPVRLPGASLGYHEGEVQLADAEGEPLLVRRFSFGCLAADTRQYRNESPLGTWQFNGTHFTPLNAFDEVAELYRKLGLRYGMFDATPESRARAGVLRGNEFAIRLRKDDVLTAYNAVLEKHPDLLPTLLLFHEDAISGPHATRVPDLFHDRAPYKLNAQEQQRYEEMADVAMTAAKIFREKFPAVKISLGNGPVVVREEFYRQKFPSELFDSAGNEAGTFGRPPEAQPPDPVAGNASIWMDHQLLQAYGYEGKEVTQCYEIVYPGSNPGNLSLQTQADYFVRHILHSMAWGMPRIRVGGLMDVGNSYYYSNWGSSAFFTARPRIEPKPAAIAIAVLSRMLDGASFERSIDTGSDGVYLLEFRKRDGSSVLVHWVVRGERKLELALANSQKVDAVAGDGKRQEADLHEGLISLVSTATPGYIALPAGATLEQVKLGVPRHRAEPEGKVAELAPFDSLDGWQVESGRNPELEFYNPMTPRRKGDFDFKTVERFEGVGPALKVTPNKLSTGKATMPMVVELKAPGGIVLPGKPVELGLWVNGNSGWGRIIYELEDASGQRWTSIGAKAQEVSPWLGDWLTPDLLANYQPGEIADWNTDDVFGLSRINFDGWRYLAIPLPGNYPGEQYPWPANSQWKASGDGIVRYPLTLKKVIVELPEKVLHIARYEEPKRPEIYLRRLVSVEREQGTAPDQPKTIAAEYVPEAQLDIR